MFIELIRVWQDTDVLINEKPKVIEEVFLLNLDAVESLRIEEKSVREDWYNSTIHFITKDGQESVFLHCKNTYPELKTKLSEINLLK